MRVLLPCSLPPLPASMPPAASALKSASAPGCSLGFLLEGAIMKMHDRLNQALAVLTLLLGAAFFGSQALAQEAPDALVERLSQEVLDILKSDKDLQAGNAR